MRILVKLANKIHWTSRTLITPYKHLSQATHEHKQHLGMHKRAASHSNGLQRLTVLMYFSHLDISLV